MFMIVNPEAHQCKICSGPSPLFGVIDFHKSCIEAQGKRLPLSGRPIYYRRCTACGFAFTDEFDDWSAEAFLASPRLVETNCLIVDVQLPAMTGIELYRHLIETGWVIPTILVTAYPDDAARVDALKEGIVCYLRKPVDDEQLKRCLDAAFNF